MAQPHIALPQDEPLLDLVNVPPAAFKKIFKTTRNIIQTTISTTITTPEMLMKDDVWAYPQASVEIKANSAGQFEEIFNRKDINLFGNLGKRILWRVPLMVRRSVSQSEDSSSILLRATIFKTE